MGLAGLWPGPAALCASGPAKDHRRYLQEPSSGLCYTQGRMGRPPWWDRPLRCGPAREARVPGLAPRSRSTT